MGTATAHRSQHLNQVPWQQWAQWLWVQTAIEGWGGWETDSSPQTSKKKGPEAKVRLRSQGVQHLGAVGEKRLNSHTSQTRKLRPKELNNLDKLFRYKCVGTLLFSSPRVPLHCTLWVIWSAGKGVYFHLPLLASPCSFCICHSIRALPRNQLKGTPRGLPLLSPTILPPPRFCLLPFPPLTTLTLPT
jgi:hypothetical protein